ncbi:MAG: hypothetical protein ISS26_06335 [Candidatus Omnitrophica bacterium]|nr:hypothetical protein [Candidatus Omnitrophota bacterium]
MDNSLKNKWLYYGGCFFVPHVMLGIGVIFASRKDLEHRCFGLRLCRISTVILIAGSLAYYVFFTPIIGLD